MKKTTIAGLVGLIFTPTVFAASATSISSDEVVVTASRIEQPKESVIADVSVIDSEQIERAGQSTLIELLQTQPGVEISSNGGAGKTSSVYLRGTNADHVVVLIDGMRMNSATLGTTTFENIPLEQIEKIEILRGPATSLYGQDAVGGVIQIFTKKGTDKTNVYASLGYGTYNTSIGSTGIRGRVNDTSYALNVSASNTDGFSALNTNNPNFNDKDGYNNKALTANVSQKLADGHTIGLQLFESDGKTLFDNSFNSGNFSSYDKLEQQSFALSSTDQWTSIWKSTLRVGASRDKLKNYDEINSGNPFNPTVFNTLQQQVNWQNDLSLPVGVLTLMYDRLEDDVTSTTIYDKTNRVNQGYVASYLANIGAHSFQTSIREDHNSQFGSHLTGGLGYGFSFNSNWRATASYGTAFKSPTFNDLYYPGFSNPNLKPEQSENIEASLRYEEQGSHVSATVFNNNIKDLISFDLTTFTIENVSKAQIKGLTLAGGQRLGNFNIESSIDLQSPRNETTDKLLPRRAERHGSLNLGYDLGEWHFGGEFIASSGRYNDSANTKPMSGYGIFNLLTTYKVNTDWTVQARVNNLFDKYYTLAYDGNNIAYNTPGANLFVSIRYSPSN